MISTNEIKAILCTRLHYQINLFLIMSTITGWPLLSMAASAQKHYYAHDAVEDQYGVIAPWYGEQNGLVDYRVRVAADFLKRYPWVVPPECVMSGPHWVFNARVDLDPGGTIKVLPATDQMNGNLGQRFKYITEALPRYYRYTGDATVLGYLKISADFLLDYYLTPEDHAWPRFPISVPLAGKPYGAAEPGGWIQLDLAAGIGLGLIRVYQMTYEPRYLQAAKHIGDVFAAKCSLQPRTSPWNRYAEGSESPWGLTQTGNQMTGGLANILIFLDELIRLNYTGQNQAIVHARDAGRDYLRGQLLPAWTVNDTWGRHYWDWEHPVQGILPTGWVTQYLMDHQDFFPEWKYNVRNILSLYLNHACVSPESKGDAYNGAWALPEGSSCCGQSLDICPVFLGRFWARYAVEAKSDWAREIVRRATILSFYHFHGKGMVEDNIDGGQITAREWSELIGFGPILCGLEIMAWLPDLFGPARENHLVHSSSIVNDIIYGRGLIQYSTFDAPEKTIDVLRLTFQPHGIQADGQTLQQVTELTTNGFITKQLPDKDCIVTIRHDGFKTIRISGEDPQQSADGNSMAFEGEWSLDSNRHDEGGQCRVAENAGSVVSFRFHGNQVRLIGRFDSEGGLADVCIDGIKQLAGIDCWTPLLTKFRQVLFYSTGLSQATHELKVVVRGEKNPCSLGRKVFVDALQWSAETVQPGFGSGEGPTEPQRMIFGYSARQPYIDSNGNEWLPGTEFVVRSGHNTDSVEKAWWTQPVTSEIQNAKEPEIYRFGIHAHEFWVNATVAPGVYQVILHFAERREPTDPERGPMNIMINGDLVIQDLDVANNAGGIHRALDVPLSDVHPRNGLIEIRLSSSKGEAILQGLEIIPTSFDK